MKVVVATPMDRQRDRLVHIVTALGHQVTMLVDEPPWPSVDADMVIAHHQPKGSWVAAMRRHGDHHIIAMVSSLDGRTIRGAVDAGADDFMTHRACPEEVVARVRLVERVRERCGIHTIPPVEELVSWAQAPKLLTQEIAEMFGLAFSDQSSNDAPLAMGAEIVATRTDDGTAIRLSVGLTAADAKKLALTLFGEPVPPSIVTDSLREMANTIGGAFKRSVMSEGITLTLGLPRNCHVDALGSASLRWVAGNPNLSVHMALSHQRERTTQVRAAGLQPGMILKHEVRSSSGSLMVAAGSAITERTAERLLNLCGPAALFEVIIPERTPLALVEAL